MTKSAARQRVAYRVLNGGRGIVHGHLAIDHVTAVRQLAAQPLLVGIQHPAQHQFAAGVDQFDAHRAQVLQGRIESARHKPAGVSLATGYLAFIPA